MICQILCIICLALTGTAQGIAMEQILEIRENGGSRKMRVLLWTGISVITGSINVIVNNQFSTISLRNFIQYSLSILLCHLFYKDRFWKKLTAIVLTIFAFSTSELLFLLTFLFDNISLDMFMDFTTNTTAFMIGMAAVISCISMQIVVYFWKKVFKEGRTMKYGMFFALYFLYKMTGMVYLQMAIWENVNVQYYSINMLLAFVCTLTLLVVIFNQAEREAVESKLSKMKIIRELEQKHYQEIRKKRESINGIIKDNRMMLYRVREKLNQECVGSAIAELERFLERVGNTKEYPFCSIPVVNTVLTEKQHICKKHNVKININIDITEDVTVNQIDLCSIFANLLDNAIHATKKMNTEKAYIALSAGIVGRYLIIKCENSRIEEEKDIIEGTGYGLKILKEIAKRYNGDFRINKQTDLFETQMILDIIQTKEV